MKHWHLFLPFAALVVLIGIMGYQYGRVSPPSETEVITRWAHEYVGWAGGAAEVTDCSARPGKDDVWIVITCRSEAPHQSITYSVDRSGELVGPSAPVVGQEA